MSFIISMVIYMQQNLAQKADYRLAVEFEAQSGIPAYGVNEQNRKEILESALKHTQIQSEDDFEKVVLWLASGEYLEEQQLAFDFIARFSDVYQQKMLSMYPKLLLDSTSEFVERRVVGLLSETELVAIKHVPSDFYSDQAYQYFCFLIKWLSCLSKQESKITNEVMQLIDRVEEKDHLANQLVFETKAYNRTIMRLQDKINLMLSTVAKARLNEIELFSNETT
ncbi:hypothetical protein C5F64_06395 [Photobacterium damselae subsp. damselae]|nr:hypothetical protein C5F64_06395 [Photobacterium damselae subsp. damselae]